MKATQALYDWLRETHGALLVLLSGGGTALLSDPIAPWTSQEVTALERVLLRSGATITEMNAVRARLSSARGGGLLSHCGGAPVFTAVWCDVAPIEWRRTASAPTMRFPARPRAEAVLRKLGISPPHPIPPPSFIKGRGEDRALSLADSHRLAQNCLREIRGLGWQAQRLLCPEGTPPEALAQMFARAAGEAKTYPTAFVGAGEAPVNVSDSGRGGRCSHLAAAVALELGRRRGWTFTALATDGVDGNAGAGAIVSWENRPATRLLRKAIAGCDTGSLLDETGSLLPRRATGNNLRDLWVLFLE